MNVVCFGDSNTYGFDPRSYFGGRYSVDARWVDILSEQTGWKIKNMGQNGLSIPVDKDESELYGRMLGTTDADFFIIMLGSNDLLQGLSPHAVAARMKRFISSFSIGKEKLLLIVPRAFKPGLWVDNENIVTASEALADEYETICKSLGIHFADANSWDVSLCYDGVHFTENGHRAFAKGLYNVLKEKEIFTCLKQESKHPIFL